MSRRKIKIGLVDADLLCNGTRHPNLVLMKLAGFLNDNGIDFKLIIDQDEDITPYKLIYISRVFTFTQMPAFYENATPVQKRKFRRGGTGFYADILNVDQYRFERNDDMTRLERDEFLNKYPNHRGGHRKNGIDIAKECSSDPLCWENEDQLNLAACFSCCLVSETSCEKRNLGLDRRALVDGEFVYFKDLKLQ